MRKMTAARKRAVSKRMKKFWADRRAAKGAAHAPKGIPIQRIRKAAAAQGDVRVYMMAAHHIAQELPELRSKVKQLEETYADIKARFPGLPDIESGSET